MKELMRELNFRYLQQLVHTLGGFVEKASTSLLPGETKNEIRIMAKAYMALSRLVKELEQDIIADVLNQDNKTRD